MKSWGKYIWVLLAPLLQTSTLFQHIRLWGVGPDLILILLVYISLRSTPDEALSLGLCLGFIEDSLSGGLFGLNILTKTLIAYNISRFGQRIDVGSPTSQIFFVVIATLTDGLFSIFVLRLCNLWEATGPALAYVILPQTIYNGLLTLMLIPMWSRLKLSRERGSGPVYRYT